MIKKKWMIITCLFLMLFGINPKAMAKDGQGQQIPVIMYHHFGQEINSTTVDPINFDQQLEYLKKQGYTTLTMNELVEYRTKKIPLPVKPIIITVDDGYESNYTEMFPILKKYNHKATVFLITGQMRGSDGLLHPDSSNKLTWQQIQEMYSSRLVDFQSHTNDGHYKLQRNGIQRGALAIYRPGENSKAYEQRVKQDLQKSKELIHRYLGYYPTVFSYPFGEFGDELDRYAKQLGFKGTVTVIEGMNRSNSDLYRLKRVNICGYDDLDTFVKKIEGKTTSKAKECLCKDYTKSVMRVEYNGVPLQLSGDIYNTKIRSTALVSVRQFGEALGLTVSWDQENFCAKIEREGSILSVYSNQDVKVNETAIIDEVRPRSIDGELYAPVRVLAKGLDLTLMYYADPERIVLKDK